MVKKDFKQSHVIECKTIPSPLVDPRGGGEGRDARPSLGVQILSFSCSFQPKKCKIIGLGAPTWGKPWIRHCRRLEIVRIIVRVPWKKFVSCYLLMFNWCHSPSATRGPHTLLDSPYSFQMRQARPFSTPRDTVRDGSGAGGAGGAGSRPSPARAQWGVRTGGLVVV